MVVPSALKYVQAVYRTAAAAQLGRLAMRGLEPATETRRRVCTYGVRALARRGGARAKGTMTLEAYEDLLTSFGRHDGPDGLLMDREKQQPNKPTRDQTKSKKIK